MLKWMTLRQRNSVEAVGKVVTGREVRENSPSGRVTYNLDPLSSVGWLHISHGRASSLPGVILCRGNRARLTVHQ
jgi:hypothetical protein